MQEEVENRTLTLVVSGTKFTGRLLKAAISKYMAHCKEKKLQKQRSRDAPVTPHGKQTVKQLIGQNQGISNIEITDPSIKEFEKIARKYGVDYAVKKDRSSSPPKYLIFFKGRDADALTAAFTEYTSKKVKKAEKTERPSVLAKLSQFKEMVKNAVEDAGIVTMGLGRRFRTGCDYSAAGKIQYFLETEDIPIIKTDYTEKVTLEYLVPEARCGQIEKKLNDLSGGMAETQDTGTEYTVTDKKKL